MTLEEAVERYLDEVSIHHKGHDVERYRLMNLLERLGRTRSLASITSKDIAALKTDRLQRVPSGAVRRELNLLSSLWATAGVGQAYGDGYGIDKKWEWLSAIQLSHNL
jgi:hypothetical protein